MKIKKIGKRASIGTTLTWVFAIFVILFILGVFLFFAFAMTGKRAISNWFDFGTTSGVISDNRADVSGTETLLTLLSTESNGKTMKKVILDSLDIYFDTKLNSGQSIVGKVGDINKLSEPNAYDLNSQLIQNNVKLVSDVQAILNSVCRKYMLRVPQGVIAEDVKLFKDESVVVGAFDTVGEIKKAEYSAWTTPVTISIPYRNQIIKLKFRMLKECA